MDLKEVPILNRLQDILAISSQRHYVEDLKNTIVLRDIVQRNQVKDLALLEDIFKFIMGYKISVGALADKEIDFVAEKSGKTIYVQVAYLLNSPKTMEREFGNLLSIKDNHEKIVISMDDVKFSDYEGVKHMHPWELL